MTNLREKIFGKKKPREDRLREIRNVVDGLAYKWSIPQTTITHIIIAWQTYEHKRFLE